MSGESRSSGPARCWPGVVTMCRCPDGAILQHLQILARSCDNTLQCEAKRFDDEEGGRALFSITREAGPRSKLHAAITADSPLGSGDIMLDRHPSPFPAGWQRADAAVDGADFFPPTALRHCYASTIAQVVAARRPPC
jgi:hypothetical protein